MNSYKCLKLDFVHFATRFSQPFDLQLLEGSCNGVFKPIAGTSKQLQVKILQNSHRKMYKVEINKRENTPILSNSVPNAPLAMNSPNESFYYHHLEETLRDDFRFYIDDICTPHS